MKTAEDTALGFAVLQRRDMAGSISEFNGRSRQTQLRDGNLWIGFCSIGEVNSDEARELN